jgi:thioredoxin 1
MKMAGKYEFKTILTIMFLAMIIAVIACRQNSPGNKNAKNDNGVPINNEPVGEKYKVTFIELGSVRCIPCQQMQVVMKSIETKYGREVKIDFHDVWTDSGKPYGLKYGIEAIPTQVFLDKDGKEYFRHVGYFAEEQLVKILQMKGVKLN